MQNDSNPLIGFAQLLERIARQLPAPPWAAELQEPEPLFKGVKEEPPPPEPPKPIGSRGQN